MKKKSLKQQSTLSQTHWSNPIGPCLVISLKVAFQQFIAFLIEQALMSEKLLKNYIIIIK